MFLYIFLLSLAAQECLGHIKGYGSISSGSNEQKNHIDYPNTKAKYEKLIPTPERLFLSDKMKESLNANQESRVKTTDELKEKDGKETMGDESEGLVIEIASTDPTRVAMTTSSTSTKKVTAEPKIEVTTSSKSNLTTVTDTRRSVNQRPAEREVLPPLHPRYRRIFNPDELATIEEYPFVAALMMNRELWCGAAIIDTDKVLTAAHCLQLQYNNRFFREYVRMLTVRVGSTNATAGGEVYRVSEIYFHPNYKPETLEFNLAILGLHRNITFGVTDPVVEKIDYSVITSIPNDSKILFLGWGSVLNRDGSGGQTLLQKVELPIYDIADCQEIYGKDLVTRNNFCAGYITTTKNVCNHDAGGPAILNGELVGTLSFSAARCDEPDHPAVFTSMGPVASWIDQHIGTRPRPTGHKLRQH